ncbi:hypothetical protein FOPG_09107 [Fusarium oxysporum f. sp. conglutinans race 2 54008]|uniref:Uncharacterized protein n=1 Tax=Fusarium oxysporum f. sp. conglutinans race 2 54008 TaxID=1089457 RepID=X0HWP2_FUSOX|nr:hypothetical protein FOPG_09107 [Fusarium oxysporum f. sp. conglutinans race 2 54008]
MLIGPWEESKAREYYDSKGLRSHKSLEIEQPVLGGISCTIKPARPTNGNLEPRNKTCTNKYASNDAVNDADAAEARGTTEVNGENGDREPGKGKKEKKKKKKKKNKHDGILPIKLILVLLYATLDGSFLT